MWIKRAKPRVMEPDLVVRVVARSNEVTHASALAGDLPLSIGFDPRPPNNSAGSVLNPDDDPGLVRENEIWSAGGRVALHTFVVDKQERHARPRVGVHVHP